MWKSRSSCLARVGSPATAAQLSDNSWAESGGFAARTMMDSKGIFHPVSIYWIYWSQRPVWKTLWDSVLSKIYATRLVEHHQSGAKPRVFPAWIDRLRDGWCLAAETQTASMDGWMVGRTDVSLHLCLYDLCVHKIQYPWVEAGTDMKILCGNMHTCCISLSPARINVNSHMHLCLLISVLWLYLLVSSIILSFLSISFVLSILSISFIISICLSTYVSKIILPYTVSIVSMHLSFFRSFHPGPKVSKMACLSNGRPETRSFHRSIDFDSSHSKLFNDQRIMDKVPTSRFQRNAVFVAIFCVVFRIYSSEWSLDVILMFLSCWRS